VRADGTKAILGLWLEQNEGAKFWLRVMNELKNRGVEDVLIAAVDSLKGVPRRSPPFFRKRRFKPASFTCCATAVTDAAVNIAPDLAAKVDTCRTRSISPTRCASPKRVAILSDEDRQPQGAVDDRGRGLCKMTDRGQIAAVRNPARGQSVTRQASASRATRTRPNA
jgi:mutator family transposase